MGLCTKFVVMICQRAAEKLAYVLFAVKFDWLSQPMVLNLKKPLIFCVVHGLNIIFAQFQDDWTKFVVL